MFFFFTARRNLFIFSELVVEEVVTMYVYKYVASMACVNFLSVKPSMNEDRKLHTMTNLHVSSHMRLQKNDDFWNAQPV